ncbi:MAG TPA: hypothetical protein VGQ44_17315 [Gemmatimonadaceae bacterium]|jgi:membrane protein DedA with SNARE-associated domain|nr:hypothetical protein [Gemmatimonadaceae bacterium]
MNLYPLIFALIAIVLGAVVSAVWPNMDAQYKRLLYIVIAVVVVVCIIAVFWPLFDRGMSTRVT